ncbi:hypothetical protein Franean1_0471 [Parafrankia sp. EAN1pec]|nr:hypothetical protein Franean1_0471 [Frankia sp. EAN1pec]
MVVSLGRRLEVTTTPLLPFTNWRFTPASSEQLRTAASKKAWGDSRSIIGEFNGDQPSPWTAWIPEQPPPHSGPDTVTVAHALSAGFEPGRTFGVYPVSERNRIATRPGATLRKDARLPGGRLIEPATEPAWLTRLLTPDPHAFAPWEHPVDRVEASHDGAQLLLSIRSARGETPATVQIQELSDRLDVLVSVGIEPGHGPLPVPGEFVPSSPIGSRPGRRAGLIRLSPERLRLIRVTLTHPLGDRAVYDLAHQDQTARDTARRAWKDQWNS